MRLADSVSSSIDLAGVLQVMQWRVGFLAEQCCPQCFEIRAAKHLSRLPPDHLAAGLTQGGRFGQAVKSWTSNTAAPCLDNLLGYLPSC